MSSGMGESKEASKSRLAIKKQSNAPGLGVLPMPAVELLRGPQIHRIPRIPIF
jgi:hypothetical protein